MSDFTVNDTMAEIRYEIDEREIYNDIRSAIGIMITETVADADATYPIEDIVRLVGILEQEELDFLTTNRFGFMEKNAMSFRNRMGNAILSFTTRLLFSINLKDSQSGMWVFKRNILGRLALKSNTPLSQELKIEACHFAKCRWKEVPIRYTPRLGEAKLGGWKTGFGNFLHLLKKRVLR